MFNINVASLKSKISEVQPPNNCQEDDYMFRDEAIQKAINWNLRRCISAKRFLKIVKKDLRYKAKHFQYHDKNGNVELIIIKRLSKEGFYQLKEMCKE